MADLKYDDIWVMVLIWLQLLLYGALRYVFSQLAILATFANFFSARCVYLLVDAVTNSDIPLLRRGLYLVMYAVILACMIFSSLEVALAYAILAELKLFEHQYIARASWPANLAWVGACLFTDLVPVAALAISIDSGFQKDDCNIRKRVNKEASYLAHHGCISEAGAISVG